MAKALKESPNSQLHISSELVFMKFKNRPSKFWLQMKSVCPTWRNIISDPPFIKMHLDAANDVNNLCLKRYINKDPTMKSMGLEDRETRYEHTIPVINFSLYVEILGSCNGLLLLGDDDHTYYLWNPSTQLLRQFNGPYLFRGQFRNFALGYDSTTSAYKVVRIVRVVGRPFHSRNLGLMAPPYNDSCYDATRAHIYNCKTDCWNKIKDFPYVIFENAQGVTMNGYPHWVMFRDHFGQDEVIDFAIVYFDLANEKFKEIPKPNWLVPSSAFEFGVFEGQLCFIHYTKPQNEVWIMKKHGESWINVSSLLDITSVRLPGWSSGHPSDASEDSKAFVGAQYVESLVSPYGGNDMIG